MSDTWVLVAESARARIFDPEGPNDRWSVVQEFSHIESRENGQDLRGNRPDQIQHSEEKDMKGDKPGWVFDVEDERFAKELCESLSRSFSVNAFRELIIVAPPKFLGRLRRNLTAPVRKVVKLEIDKDYTQFRPEQLADHVPNL
jgi:protein required for attachment to host cells